MSVRALVRAKVEFGSEAEAKATESLRHEASHAVGLSTPFDWDGNKGVETF